MYPTIVQTQSDVGYFLSQNQAETERIVSGMTALIDANEQKFSAMQKQKWFQRIWYTITGQNKATVQEMEQNRDKLAGYCVQVISRLINEKKISDMIMTNLQIRVNEIYSSYTQQSEIFNNLINNLNDKIIDVDSYHNLITDIQNRKYDSSKPFISLLLILSMLNRNVVTDRDHLRRLKETMQQNGFDFSSNLSIADITDQFFYLPEDSIGQVHLFLQNHTEYMFIAYACCLVEMYFFQARSNRSVIKNTAVQSAMDYCELNPSMSCDFDLLYGDITESIVTKIETLRTLTAPKDSPVQWLENTVEFKKEEGSGGGERQIAAAESVSVTRRKSSKEHLLKIIEEASGSILEKTNPMYSYLNIPAKVQSNLSAFKGFDNMDDFVAIFATNVLHDGKHGIIFTTNGMFIRNIDSKDGRYIDYEDIETVFPDGWDCSVMTSSKEKIKIIFCVSLQNMGKTSVIPLVSLIQRLKKCVTEQA